MPNPSLLGRESFLGPFVRERILVQADSRTSGLKARAELHLSEHTHDSREPVQTKVCGSDDRGTCEITHRVQWESDEVTHMLVCHGPLFTLSLVW